MGSATNSTKLALGNHILRTATYAKPAAIYVALFTTLPALDGTGGVEVTGGSYARVVRGPGDAYWTVPVGDDGIFSNVAAVIFAAPTADWGNIIGAGIYDASSGGILIARALLDTARNVINGDPTPNFPIGSLKFIFA